MNSKVRGVRRSSGTHHGDVGTGFVGERVPASTVDSEQRTDVSCIDFTDILKKGEFIGNTERHVMDDTWFEEQM